MAAAAAGGRVASSGISIVEPSYPPAVQQKLQLLRQTATAALLEDGFTYTADFSSPLKSLHWRDIYHRFRHRTTVVCTPDPRLEPSYRPACESLDWPDWHLHRFLKARKMDVEAARRQLVNTLAWRRHFGTDDLAAQPVCPWWEIRAALIPERVHHTDSAGRPLVVACYGPIDTDRVLSELSLEMMFVLEVWKLESYRRVEQQLSEAAGRRVLQLTVVLDAAGCTLHHRLLMQWVNANNAVGMSFYPEFLHQLVLINTPSFFPLLWRVVSPMLDQQIRDKLAILGQDHAAALKQRIGAACLPREWGGQCQRCGDGPCLPQLAERDQEEERRRDRERVEQWARGPHESEQILIAARRHRDVDIAVRRSSGHSAGGCTAVTVWWSLQLEHRDLDFSVSFIPQSCDTAPAARHAQDAQELQPVSRLQAGQPSVGWKQFVLREAEEEGTLRLRLSNEMSLWSSKSVMLKHGRLETVEPHIPPAAAATADSANTE